MRLISSGTPVHLIKCNIHSPSNIANVHVDVLTIFALFAALRTLLLSFVLFRRFQSCKLAILIVPIILTELILLHGKKEMYPGWLKYHPDSLIILVGDIGR